MHKKLLLYLFMGLLLVPCLLQAKTRSTPQSFLLEIGNTTVLTDDLNITLPMAPQIINDRTYIPFRFLAESILEATPHYEEATGHITLIKDGLSLTLVVDSSFATLNGEKIALDAPIIRLNGTAFLPLRFIIERFELDLEYFPDTQHILIQKPFQEPNNPPTASFQFNQSSYTVGEILEATVDAQDPDGDAIVEERWVLNQVWSKPYTSLEALSKNLTHDFVSISLQVKDARGLWSPWYTSYIVITPSMPPTITSLTTPEKTYAQGEPLTFDYTYVNEDFESIVAERWLYRKLDDTTSRWLTEKPHALYTKGKYNVRLQIQDSAGHWSEAYDMIVNITDKVVETEFHYLFTEGIPGSIITNFIGTNFRSYKDVTFHQEDHTATLIMSNSPELVSSNGLLYEEYVDGIGRMLFHHINDFSTSTRKQLMVIIENEGDTPVYGTLSNFVTRGPSDDVLFVGQQLLYDYLAADTSSQLVLQPQEKKVLYTNNPRAWLRNQCISGMFDFDFEGEVKLSVVAVDASTTLDTLPLLQVLPRDVHPRGTFDITDRSLTIDLANQKAPSKLLISDQPHEWLKGNDGLTGEVTINKGNYGVAYSITVTADEDTAVILNPRANIFKGAIKWGNAQPFYVPRTDLFTDGRRAAFLGVVKKGTTETFTYMIPNGSSAPVLIGFIPKSHW